LSFGGRIDCPGGDGAGSGKGESDDGCGELHYDIILSLTIRASLPVIHVSRLMPRPC
jgi:hypothetical protein